MANTYRVTGARPVLDIEPGCEGELDLTASQEADLLSSGRLELVPREYENVGARVVHGAKPGQKFKASLRIPEEQALIAAGHIERTPTKKPAARSKPAA